MLLSGEGGSKEALIGLRDARKDHGQRSLYVDLEESIRKDLVKVCIVECLIAT